MSWSPPGCWINIYLYRHYIMTLRTLLCNTMNFLFSCTVSHQCLSPSVYFQLLLGAWWLICGLACIPNKDLSLSPPLPPSSPPSFSPTHSSLPFRPSLSCHPLPLQTPRPKTGCPLHLIPYLATPQWYVSAGPPARLFSTTEQWTWDGECIQRECVWVYALSAFEVCLRLLSESIEYSCSWCVHIGKVHVDCEWSLSLSLSLPHSLSLPPSLPLSLPPSLPFSLPLTLDRPDDDEDTITSNCAKISQFFAPKSQDLSKKKHRFFEERGLHNITDF